MKSSKKVLAFALAAAMVVTAVPATNAQAASTAKLSAKKATVYSEGYKTVTVKTPKSWKSVKVTATSNKKSVATVKKTAAKKIKVTGVKPGTAKVTVKVTYKTSTKKSAKAKTKKLTYTMKVAKVGVALSGDSVVAIGNTTKLTNTKKNSSRAKITYTSSDDSIATVAADGTVTGVKAGKVTITAKITVGKDSATTTKDVEVKKAILKDATQTEVTKIVATVAGDTKDLKAGDFKVTNTATNATVAVKSATADKKDSSKVTIETFTEMKDAKEYSVVYDGVTVKFTATDGTPSKVGVDTVQIAAGTRTKVQATLTDVNGVVLSRTDLDKNDSSKGKVTSAVTLTKGYQDGSILYLPAVGDTATIKVTYHTGTFGTDGKEAGNIEDTFTVTAVDPSMINYNFAVTISDNIPAWKANSFKANDKIAMGTDKNAYFRITKDDGNEIADALLVLHNEDLVLDFHILPPYSMGRVMRNSAPPCFWFSAVIVPPWAVTTVRQTDRPMPISRRASSRPSSGWSVPSNRCSSRPRAMPTPLSATSRIAHSSFRLREISIWFTVSPWRAAFSIKLNSTCCISSGSIGTSIGSSGRCTCTVMPL